MTGLIFYIGCSCSIGSQFDLFVCFQYCDDQNDARDEPLIESSAYELFNNLSTSLAHANAENLPIDILVIEIKSWDVIHAILSMVLDSISQEGYVIMSNVHPMYPSEAEYPNPVSSFSHSSFWLGDSWKVCRQSVISHSSLIVTCVDEIA